MIKVAPDEFGLSHRWTGMSSARLYLARDASGLLFDERGCRDEPVGIKVAFKESSVLQPLRNTVCFD
jgi:hypothetical protein